MAYKYDYGPFDSVNMPVATHNPYKETDQGRCRHCRMVIVYVHSTWNHAARAWDTSNPDRWWWSPTSKANHGCIGATK